MGAQTVRTVTPLSKCWATWCFFPAQTSATREKPPNSWSSPYVSHLKPARITVYLPSVSGQEGQRVRRAEQGTHKGNQKPTKLFVRQHWPQTEIFHTKEALHRTATFIKKGNFTPTFGSSPRDIHQNTRFNSKTMESLKFYQQLSQVANTAQHEHKYMRGLNFTLRCDGMGAISNMSWKDAIITLPLHIEFHPGHVGDVWQKNASSPSNYHWLTNSPGQHGLSTPLASPTKVVFRKRGRSRQPWLSPITFLHDLNGNSRQNLDSQQLLSPV